MFVPIASSQVEINSVIGKKPKNEIWWIWLRLESLQMKFGLPISYTQ